MRDARIDYVELGFRSLRNQGFKGALAYTTDSYLSTLPVPETMSLGVMINASELFTELGVEGALKKLFPRAAEDSMVKLVRIASHFHELPQAFLAADWLKRRGYCVGVNLMQIADRTENDIRQLAVAAPKESIDVLYFADSMGSMTPDGIARTVGFLRQGWGGELGIHTHDNIGLALANTLRAQSEGVTWLDATVTGMGHGPGNARMEELIIELTSLREDTTNLVPLLSLIRNHLGAMKQQHGWGTNPYYYLGGKYGIHPTFIQEMLADSRYSDVDIFAVLEHLRSDGGKKYSKTSLDDARCFYNGDPNGTWRPSDEFANRDVLILGSGPSVSNHRDAIERFITRFRPLVLALNTQEAIDTALIDLRVACHPVRIRADLEAHAKQRQALIAPAALLTETMREDLRGKRLLDFGLVIEEGKFEFNETYCVSPTPLVLGYALAIAVSGKSRRIAMAGFDGYSNGGVRNEELERILDLFSSSSGVPDLLSITPTCLKSLPSASIYGFLS